MRGLYERLFRYRERPLRTPLEDYLSEALADLLGRMPPQRATEMVADLLLPATGRNQWKAWLTRIEYAEICFSTQFRLEGAGVADIVITVNNNPALFVENKIASGFGPDQLQRYGGWLSAHRATNPDHWPGAIALLTHTCEPPGDFVGSEGCAYGVPYRRVVRWHEVCKRLKLESEGGPSAHWSCLALDLADFLKKKGLGGEVINSMDLAAAQVYLPSARRLEETFERVWQYCADIKKLNFIQSSSGMKPTFDGEEGTIWAWAYLKLEQAQRKNGYFGFGFRFPILGELWNESSGDFPQQPYLFCRIGADYADIPAIRNAEQAGWLCAGGEIIRAFPLHELPTEPAEFAASLGRWVRQGLEDALALLADIFIA